MQNAGAYITTSESAIFEILGDSTHEHFKSISRFLSKNAELFHLTLYTSCSLVKARAPDEDWEGF